jgi:hypothetical protein
MLRHRRLWNKMGLLGGLLLLFITSFAFSAYYEFRTSEVRLQSFPPPFAGAGAGRGTCADAGAGAGRGAATLSGRGTGADAGAGRGAATLSSTTTNNDVAASNLLPEWTSLSAKSQEELGRLLSWESLSTFDYGNMFHLDELTQGHSLLFISWTVLASPQAQQLLKIRTIDTEEGDTNGYNLLESFQISPDVFLEFVRRIEKQYLDSNPYHNRVHAADVVQTLHSLLQFQSSFMERISDDHLLSIFLAAILHDVGHDGTNNDFQIQQQTSLAVRYKNHSVLENHHAELGWNEVETTGLLRHLPTYQQHEIQQRVSEAILHTDMSRHDVQLAAYHDGLLDDWGQLMYFLHLSDISNSAKSTFRVWTDHVLEEFFQLGDRQCSLEVPVTPIYDRNTADRGAIQRGFVQYMVLPAFEAVSFTDESVLDRLRTNFEYWKAEAEAEEEEAAKQ